MSTMFRPSLFNKNEVVEILKQNIRSNDSVDFRNLSAGTSDEDLDELVDGIYAYRFELEQGLIWLGSKEKNIAFNEFELMADSVMYHGLSTDKYLYRDSSITEVLKSYKSSQKIQPELAARAEKNLTKNFLRMVSDLLYGVYNPRDFFTHKVWSASNDSSRNTIQTLELISTKGGAFALIDSLTPKHAWYMALVDQMTHLLSIQKEDSLQQIIIKNNLKLGDSSEVVGQIYQRLGKLFGIESGLLGSNFDQKMQELVRKFQRMYRQEITGVIDQEFVKNLNTPIEDQISRLRRDFERWHWSKKDFSDEYIIVNIPEFRLYYCKGDTTKIHMNCVVGKTSRMTPTIDARMTDIVINPTWTVPPTILKKDLLPSIKRRGGYAVSRRGLTAYDRRGRRVSPGRINSGNYKSFRYVQKPSYHNSLGTIKFNMPNPELVYIHDTNHRWGFNNPVRTRSSGCVRVQHPRDMATLILNEQGYTRDIIDSLIKKAKTRSVKLEREIMAHFMYFTSGLDSTGSLVYYRDVYKLDTVFKNTSLM